GHIERLVRPFLDDPAVQVTTLKILAKPEEVPTRTANKVVTNIHGDALYFSRLAIPCDRDGRGLYAYRRAVLERSHALPPSPLERAEQLEQLRLLEHGIPIRVVETDEPTVGGDPGAGPRGGEALLPRRHHAPAS